VDWEIREGEEVLVVEDWAMRIGEGMCVAFWCTAMMRVHFDTPRIEIMVLYNR